MGGAANREFGTFQQCQATVGEIGGFCIPTIPINYLQARYYQPGLGEAILIDEDLPSEFASLG